MILKRHLVKIIVILGVTHMSNAAFLRCYNETLQNYIEAPLEDTIPLFSSTCINKSLPTVIYTFGYQGNVTGRATTAMLTAYLRSKKRNVLLLNWEKEAASGMLGIAAGYAMHAVPNAHRTGKDLGKALITVAREGLLNMTHLHLIGHSLGAHLMGFAGRLARQGGYVIPRITGLDPARALFEGLFNFEDGLDKTCARFVDIIHTDPGNYGTSKPSGTVDLWPNYSGNSKTQPGCPSGNFEMFSQEDLCSHDRSWRFYSESIEAPTAFPASEAKEFNEWVAKNGNSENLIYLGEITNIRARGNYFLTTNSDSPFGKGHVGLKPNSNSNKCHGSPTNLLWFFR